MTQADRTKSPEASCLGKHGFASYEQAAKTIGKGPIHLAPFRCVSCSKWHIGSHKRTAVRAPVSKRKTGGAPRRLMAEADEA